MTESKVDQKRPEIQPVSHGNKRDKVLIVNARIEIHDVEVAHGGSGVDAPLLPSEPLSEKQVIFELTLEVEQVAVAVADRKPSLEEPGAAIDSAAGFRVRKKNSLSEAVCAVLTPADRWADADKTPRTATALQKNRLRDIRRRRSAVSLIDP
ncbi:MAG TPA: hypothetical protein VMV68_04610 [Spirochaetia bacterium]|nr:hypothetical protein [Spirochaetia bacterium]